MAVSSALKPVGHEERLSLVDHLDELRTRLIVCIATFVVAFAFCAWQSDELLHIINKPLISTAPSQGGGGGGLRDTEDAQAQLRAGLLKVRDAFDQFSTSKSVGRDPADRAAAERASAGLDQAIKALPEASAGRRPVTLGVGEPFMATMTVAAYFALLISLPLILYQLYAFVLPALSPRERRAALPLLTLVPVLFIAGVLFGYFAVLPPTLKFLQNFNKDSFDILIQARDYYKFAVFILISLGVMFQIPVVVIGLTQLDILTPQQLRKGRRFAIVAIAVLAMTLPSTDPVSMAIEMIPLLLLFELSILVASVLDRRRKQRQRDEDRDQEEHLEEHEALQGDEVEPPVATTTDTFVPPQLDD